MTWRLTFASGLTLACLTTGCAQFKDMTGMDDKTASTVGGALAGCVGGAAGAQALGNGKNALLGCGVGAVIGGWIGYEKARQEEIAAAEQMQREARESLSRLPPARGGSAHVGEVKTIDVSARDKNTHEVRRYKAFDSVTIDLPLAAKGTPEYDGTVEKIKRLAEKVADERGTSAIIIGMNAADAKQQSATLGTDSVKSKSGPGVIYVTKRIERGLANGVQRMTIHAGKLSAEV